MTKKERAERARIKKAAIDMGLRPLPQKRINRKKYVGEVMKRYEECGVRYGVNMDIIAHMIARMRECGKRVGDDVLEFARIFDLAIRDKEFSAKLNAEGRDSYNIDEYMREVYYKVYPKEIYKKQEGDNSGE